MANLKGFDNIKVLAKEDQIDDIIKEKGLLQYKLVQVLPVKYNYWLFFTRETELEIINTCKFCVHFDETQFFCRFHEDSTKPEDSCKNWSSVEEI